MGSAVNPTQNTPFLVPKANVSVAAIVVPTVIDVTILVFTVVGSSWIIYRRHRRDGENKQRQSKLTTEFREPQSKGLPGDGPGSAGAGAGARITVTLADTEVSDPDLVVIDRSYLEALTDTSSLSSMSTSTRRYDTDATNEADKDMPFFQRLKLLRRAGEMPRRKSLVLDQCAEQQLSNNHARVEMTEVEVQSPRMCLVSK